MSATGLRAARAGLIVPSSNPTIERFLQRSGVAALLGLDVLVTRIRVRRIAADAAADAQFELAALVSAGSLLADADVTLICWAGTSGFWLGGDREDSVLGQVAAAVGVPVVSSRIAMLAALAQRPADPVGVLTPYLPAVHDRVVATVRAAGHPVVADHCLGIERNLDFAAIPAVVVAAELRKLADCGAGSLAVVCTNVLGVVPGLATERYPVVDSVLATLWHAALTCGSYGASYASCYADVCRRAGGCA